jgi:hypothetical protein
MRSLGTPWIGEHLLAVTTAGVADGPLLVSTFAVRNIRTDPAIRTAVYG